VYVCVYECECLLCVHANNIAIHCLSSLQVGRQRMTGGVGLIRRLRSLARRSTTRVAKVLYCPHGWWDRAPQNAVQLAMFDSKDCQNAVLSPNVLGFGLAAEVLENM
jgi:hypothetical protein